VLRRIPRQSQILDDGLDKNTVNAVDHLLAGYAIKSVFMPHRLRQLRQQLEELSGKLDECLQPITEENCSNE
jgi:hypothetical protein